LQLIEDAPFRADNELRHLRAPGVANDAGGGADKISQIKDLARALGMGGEDGVRMQPPDGPHRRGGEPVMDGTAALPGDDLTAGLPGNVTGQITVGDHENRPRAGEGTNHPEGVGGGAADVAVRLDNRRRIDVGHDLRLGVFLPGGGKLGRRHHVSQGTAGLLSRQQNRLVGGEDGGAFRHEMHPGKDDCLGVRPGGLDAQSQGIAAIIGYFLHLVSFVVVGQEDGVFFPQQSADLFLQLFLIHGLSTPWGSSPSLTLASEQHLRTRPFFLSRRTLYNINTFTSRANMPSPSRSRRGHSPAPAAFRRLRPRARSRTRLCR